MRGRIAYSRPALAAFAVAAIPRLLAWWYFPSPRPNYNYWLSESLLTVHAFTSADGPTSFNDPGYPAFLALLRAVANDRMVLLLQALVSATGAAAIYLLTARITGRTAAAAGAAAFYAVDPYFVRQGTSYIELPFLLPLFLWSLERYTAIRDDRNAAVTGALFAVLLLTRSSMMPFSAGAVALLAIRQRWRHALIVAGVAGAMLLPWIVRSYRANNVILPMRAGENLYVSTSEYAVGVVPEHDVGLLIRFAQMRIDEALQNTTERQYEAVADRALIEHTWRFVVTHPMETVKLKLRNLLWIPSPLLLPRHAKSEYTHAAFVNGRTEITGLARRPLLWEALHALARSILLIAAIIGFTRRRGLDDGVLLLALGCEAAIYTIFFPTTRLLGPFDSVLMVYGGLGMTARRK